KPQPEQLQDVDVLIFDLQDVGARFYTYLSSLYLLMEAAAENKLPLIVLDRPNPNGHYVDGPVLDLKHKSFVGMLPIPVVHGMTLGEMAQMINGENWLPNGLQCDLQVIKVSNYDHRSRVKLPVAPSPNLPNAQAVALYPSLCFMEKTVMSIGRGTSMQFQIYGHPDYAPKTFQFTPQPNQGSKYPKLEGQIAYGVDLREVKVADRLDLQWLMDAYTHTKFEGDFFMDSFEILSGTDTLRKQIQAGLSEDAIRDSWKEGLMTFKAKRKNYLLYTDFE
ncbi:MAG: exo-beta-N-acetylmuramidase NamZ family protein, partial [Flavobacteriaceae bacterium]